MGPRPGLALAHRDVLDVSEAVTKRPPRDLYRFFVAALAANPQIKNTVARRRFEFAQVLEEAELATTPANDEDRSRFPAAVVVTWGDIVDRMVRYLKAHNFDLVVRAHQVVEDGYEFFHGRKLVTVFSAPNYWSVAAPA